MPKPRAGEEKDAYISRCVSQLIKEEGKEQKQALAICFSMWERKDEEKPIEDKIDLILNEHFMSKGSGHRYPGQPDNRHDMKCHECGKKFKKKIGKNTYEVKCPKCGSYDTDID